MFGTLVLVLPTKHEGGALAFRHSGQEWAFDSAKALSDDEKSIAYVAFIGDMQHEVLPVVSGYRVMYTDLQPALPRALCGLCTCQCRVFM